MEGGGGAAQSQKVRVSAAREQGGAAQKKGSGRPGTSQEKGGAAHKKGVEDQERCSDGAGRWV